LEYRSRSGRDTNTVRGVNELGWIVCWWPASVLAQSGAESAGDEYGAVAEVEPVEPGEIEIESDELADLPSAFGDPFRAVELLPGTAPIQTLSPFVIVRGAPPSSTFYAYDDIPLPAIAHLAAGPSLFHPSVIGELRFDPGVAPARYGRFTGAVIAATAADAPEEPFGEIELRLLDLSGVLDVPFGQNRVQASTHIGYPGLIYQLTAPEATFQYYDYLARFEHHFGDGGAFHAIALGSYDMVENPPWSFAGDDSATMEMQFHRLELRFVRERDDIEFGSALRFGADDSTLANALAVTAISIAPRVWASYDGDDVRARVGADFVGSFGHIDDPPGLLMGPGGTIAVDLPFYAEAAARETSGVYAELAVRPIDALTIDAGLRGDVWITSGSGVEIAPSPRLEVAVTPIERLRVHAGVALNYQPAVYAFPVPGLTETSIDRGLQRAIQTEIGAALDLPEDVRVDVAFYLNDYDDLLLLENNWGWQSIDCNRPDGCALTLAPPRSEMLSYGGELMVRRTAETGLSGWLTYTLAWNRAWSEDRHHFTPVHDVRHVLNLLASYRFDFGLVAGARVLLRSGLMGVAPVITAEGTVRMHQERLPGSARLDVRIGYDWDASWAELGVYAEFMNVTLASDADALLCPPLENTGPCVVHFMPAVWAPNAGFRATFR
jgi:hypothetical protein